jgi:hypothetical protein
VRVAPRRLELAIGVRHPVRVPQRLPKAIRVITGIVLMAAFVVVVTAIVLRQAGGWGVPFFPFTSERGSSCKNTLTGYVCQPLTLADVEFHGDIDLPDDTAVTSGTYVSTHDYRLDAQLTVPAASAKAAAAALQAAFGTCQKGRPAPMDVTGLKAVCVFANDDAVTDSQDTSSRLFLIGTGLAPDGTRQIALSIKSR